MSLMFYGVLILGVVLGGAVLLVLFSLLAMAKKGEESFEKLEFERFQARENPHFLPKRGKTNNLGVPTTSDLYHGGAN
jgi:hypothetical protein